MPERGGPTTQSGILYQNSVAALYLGRLCDETPRPDGDRVVRVRVEAPTEVDDTVVYYADEHTAFIQAKENVRSGDEAWREVWRDFSAQYRWSNFAKRRDRLRLHIGEWTEEHRHLRELCERARTSEGAREWRERLSQPQQRLADKIGTVLGPVLSGGDEVMREFLAHVEVQLWTLDQIEQGLVRAWMPVTSQLPKVSFRLLRDRVGGEARVRGSFEAKPLRESLAAEGVDFHAPPDLNQLRSAAHECGASAA